MRRLLIRDLYHWSPVQISLNFATSHIKLHEILRAHNAS